MKETGKSGIALKFWDEITGELNMMVWVKAHGVPRKAVKGDSLTSRARSFWVRSRDILANDRVSSNSDKLPALAYTFALSEFFTVPIMMPELQGSEDWLWEAYFIYQSFQTVIAKPFKCGDADWMWADQIALETSDPRMRHTLSRITTSK